VSYHILDDVTCNVLGIVTEDDKHFEQLELILLTPGSPAERHLANKNVFGYYILSMNGVCICSVTMIFDSSSMIITNMMLFKNLRI
jgi:hypothetical protein